MNDRYILAIETSCDDTCIAINHNDKILSNIVLSSEKFHKKYGGIVPEIAARTHETNLSICYEKTIKAAKIKPNQITHIAYTSEPGLPGSLHMGKIFAKSLGKLLNKPIVPINHMNGHIYSFAIDNKNISYPFISLVVSGGHTSLYLVKSTKDIQLLNETADDAIGETLDKVGRILGFDYPGGVSIDRSFNINKTNLKLINHFKAEEKFSFSGIKTHVLNLVNQYKIRKQKIDKILISSSLLKWMIDEVVIKINYQLKLHPQVKFVSIGGGVSANGLLRKEIKNIHAKVMIPKLKYTNDNAAMVAIYCEKSLSENSKN
jgi:N6-L-threonylcarbamoyladenine synthase